MNWRRYFLALGTTAVLTLVADVLLNAVVFRDVYTRSSSFLLPVNELNSRMGRVARHSWRASVRSRSRRGGRRRSGRHRLHRRLAG